MKKILFLTSLVFSTILFSNCTQKVTAPSSYPFTIIQENLDEAKTQANSKTQNICLMVHADWCSVCNTFKSGVLTDAEVVNNIKDKIVFAMVDGDKTYGKPIATQYQVTGFPTFIILDKNGVEVKRKTGGMDKATFTTWVTPYLK